MLTIRGLMATSPFIVPNFPEADFWTVWFCVPQLPSGPSHAMNKPPTCNGFAQFAVIQATTLVVRWLLRASKWRPDARSFGTAQDPVGDLPCGLKDTQVVAQSRCTRCALGERVHRVFCFKGPELQPRMRWRASLTTARRFFGLLH